MQFDEQHKIALISILEIVLMSGGNVKYSMAVAKLNSLYNITIKDCYKHPEYLKTVLKDGYKGDYNSIIEEVKSRLGNLVNEKDIAEFLKIMES